jgi:5-(carboxyamino)imidazole ribonucleotide synthase
MRDEEERMKAEDQRRNEKPSIVHPSPSIVHPLSFPVPASALSPQPSALPILPGAKIGVLGSGQLGRMFAMAARRMGYLVHTFSPDTDTPTGQVADVEVAAAYEDLDAVRAFARGVEVVTFEFENVPATTAEAVAELVPVRPSGHVLHTTQHRLREKTFLAAHGFPVTPYRHVRTLAELRAALAALGTPAVLKTAGFGYDGKGQRLLKSDAEAADAFAALAGREAILEAFVDFEREVSVVCARGADGANVHYGVIENRHERHILDCSVAPADVSPAVAAQATEIATSLLEQLDVVGVLCVEFFLTKTGRLFVNELAPRPHNSGHLTIDACATSQFEQQVRAVCGLPLGTPAQLRPAAMANLLGDLWQQGEPNWPAACAHPHVKLHLYGKHEARAGRKMGHLTALADTTAEALQMVRAARAALTPKL